MRKITLAEGLVLFVVCMAGCSGMTAVASYYPDSDYLLGIVCVLTVALIFAVVFFMLRKKAQ